MKPETSKFGSPVPPIPSLVIGQTKPQTTTLEPHYGQSQPHPLIWWFGLVNHNNYKLIGELLKYRIERFTDSSCLGIG